MPTPRDLAVMLDVLAWGRSLDNAQWRIVLERAAGYSWEKTGDRVHLPAASVRRDDKAIEAVCAAAVR